MSIKEMIALHTIVNVTDYIHVIDGKVVCYEPDVIDFEDEKQVETLFHTIETMEEWLAVLNIHDTSDIRLIISGDKKDPKKCISDGYISDFPPKLLLQTNLAIYQYKHRFVN